MVRFGNYEDKKISETCILAILLEMLGCLKEKNLLHIRYQQVISGLEYLVVCFAHV